MTYGGVEVINNARCRGYAESAPYPHHWIRGPRLPQVAESLGDAPYALENIAEAPWYDVRQPDLSARFFGAFGLTITNVENSTRQVATSSGLADGTTIGRARRGPLQARVRALLTARGADALDYGFTWLKAALEQRGCQLHQNSCGTTEVGLRVTPPTPRPDVQMFGPWSTLHENLFTNPSFEAGSGTVEVRRNRAYNPAATTANVDNSFWAGASGVMTFAVVNPGWTATAIRATYTAMPTSGQPAHQVTALKQGSRGITATGTWTVVQSVKASGLTPTASIVGTELGAGNTVGAANGTIDLGGGVYRRWATINITDLATFNAAGNPRIDFGFSGAIGGTVGSWIETSETDIYYGNFDPNRQWFSGATPAAGDFTYAWTGTANASTSVQRATGFAGISAYPGRPGEVFQSQEWASEGGKSLRIRPSASDNDSFAEIGAIGSLLASNVGKTYTAVARVRLDAPLTGTLYPNRALRIFTNSSGASPAAPNVAGVHEIRFTFVATGSFFRLYNGASAGNGDVWWDSLTIVEVPAVETAVTRRNFFPNPVTSSATNWVAVHGVGGVATISRETTTPPSGIPAYIRSTTTTPGSSGHVRIDQHHVVPVSAAQPITFSAQFRTSAALSVQLQTVFFDAGGAYIGGGDVNSGSTSLAANTWTRVSVSGTTPAGAVRVALRFLFLNAATISGYIAEVGGVCVEHSPTLSAFFYGGSLGTLSTRYRWTGAADASSSEEYTVTVAEYTGPPFSGATPDIDATQQYLWTGTEDASTSIDQTRTSWIEPVSDAVWQAELDELTRFMHDVDITSPPFIVESMESRGVYAHIVEWTITSERAWLYGARKELDLPVTPSTVVQDIPYNLAPTPSAELSSGTAIVSRNVSANPSLEANATGWTASATLVSGTAPAAYYTNGRVTGELSAAGTASFRSRMLGNGSTAVAASVATLLVEHAITYTPAARERLSASIWAAGVIVGGASVSVITSITVSLVWLNGVTTLSTVALGSATTPGDLAGKVFAAKSLVPPATTTGAKFVISALVTWGSSATPVNNSDLRIYTDAAALTNP